MQHSNVESFKHQRKPRTILKKLDDLELSLDKNLPNYNIDSIKLYIIAHKTIISLLSKDPISPLDVSNSFHRLLAGTRALYHSQMFHALNMELLKLRVRDTVESALATTVNQEVEEMLRDIPEEDLTDFIESQIEILKNKTDRHSKVKLLAFTYKSHKINYNESVKLSEMACDILCELPFKETPAATVVKNNS